MAPQFTELLDLDLVEAATSLQTPNPTPLSFPGPPSSISSSSEPSTIAARTESPPLPSYIGPAYEWLIKHLWNPYPKKEAKENIADKSGCSVERVSEWFIDVRRRIGWTRLLREEFGRRRADMVDVAARHFHPGSTVPVPPYLQSRFVEIEAMAQDIYGHKFIPSALSKKISGAVKEMTPEPQQKAREERLEAARAAKAYPSPAPSSVSSPISGPGASILRLGHKSSRSDVSLEDDTSRKGSRNGNGISESNTPLSHPDSVSTSPPPSISLGHKRRLSEADASAASKRSRQRNISDPAAATVTLPGNPEHLADWFSSTRPGEANIFDPENLWDIQLFDRQDYLSVEEPLTLPQPAVNMATLHLPPFESDALTSDLPGFPPEFQHFIDFSAYEHPLSSSTPDPYAPLDPSPIIYQSETFIQPFVPGNSSEPNFISPKSVPESFALVSLPSQVDRLDQSAFLGGNAPYLTL